jgi:hypothetical protein
MRLTAPRALSIIGLMLVVGGVALAVSSPASFGWFAYASESASLPVATTGVSAVLPTGNIIALGPSRFAGYGSALVGLLALAVAGGFALGRRRGSANDVP